jgi:hypothetical protein
LCVFAPLQADWGTGRSTTKGANFDEADLKPSNNGARTQGDTSSRFPQQSAFADVGDHDPFESTSDTNSNGLMERVDHAKVETLTGDGGLRTTNGRLITKPPRSARNGEFSRDPSPRIPRSDYQDESRLATRKSECAHSP